MDESDRFCELFRMQDALNKRIGVRMEETFAELTDTGPWKSLGHA